MFYTVKWKISNIENINVKKQTFKTNIIFSLNIVTNKKSSGICLSSKVYECSLIKKPLF